MPLKITKKTVFTILAAAAILGLVLLLNEPMRKIFEFNPDEGIDSVKASLFLKGFPLYKQIWSDQPPLFTALLAFWFKLFGASFYHGRILVLMFSGLLLWAFYQTIRIKEGRICALTACVLLAASCSFIRLSVSIMIGLPALALAMLSIYFLTEYNRSHSRHFLALSGIFMALSLEIKFFAAFLIPVILLEIALGRKKNTGGGSSSRPFLDCLFWLGAVSLLYFAVIALFFWPDLNLFAGQLFQPHLAKPAAAYNNFPVIYNYLFWQDYDIAFLALTGMIIGIKKRNSRIILPLLWLSLASIIMLKHRPVWDHYYPLISIPVCWLAGTALSEFLKKKTWGDCFAGKKPFFSSGFLLCGTTILGIILCIGNLPLRYSNIRSGLQVPEQANEEKLLGLIAKYRNGTRWILTDAPVFAFYSGIPVPPELAVATLKRRFNGGLTGDYFLEIMEKYRPEQILIGRFRDYPPEVLSYVAGNYRLIRGQELYQKTSFPAFYRTMQWDPLGKYLPARIQTTSNKWLYGKIWHSLYIPVIKTGHLAPGAGDYKITLDLFIRNDLAANSPKPGP